MSHNHPVWFGIIHGPSVSYRMDLLQHSPIYGLFSRHRCDSYSRPTNPERNISHCLSATSFGCCLVSPRLRGDSRVRWWITCRSVDQEFCSPAQSLPSCYSDLMPWLRNYTRPLLREMCPAIQHKVMPENMIHLASSLAANESKPEIILTIRCEEGEARCRFLVSLRISRLTPRTL